MGEKETADWKRIFAENCQDWDPAHKQRYINIANDPEDIDKEELESAKELVEEISGKRPT